jgi:hypothetical protein
LIQHNNINRETEKLVAIKGIAADLAAITITMGTYLASLDGTMALF